MATSMPLPHKPQIPVTPPPDQHTFITGLFPPHLPRSDLNGPATEATGIKSSRGTTPASSLPQPNPPSVPLAPRRPGMSNHNNNTNIGNNNLSRDMAVDPRYLAMASRIASYYQQRSQAVANFQQQRCQIWANTQRQKCQEMTQAAMLIVAWYVRDRISRRRNRQRRAFKRGLKQRAKNNGGDRVTKGEAVRRWALNLPAGTEATLAESDTADKTAYDKEEAAFEMDKEDQTQNKDTQLFNVADNLIKSQLTRIHVPLLGALSFDESDDESDSEEDEDIWDDDNEEDENYEQAGDEEMAEDEEYDDDEDDDDGYEEVEYQQEEVDVAGSKSVHLSSKGTRKHTRSSYVS